MSEQAPGVYISGFVPCGRYFVMNTQGIAGMPPRSIAINPADWERVPPAERERVLDRVMRREADRGFRELARFLASGENDERETGLNDGTRIDR